MPLVSVIVPAWNAASFIGECLASAIAQDHADLEILVIDDASSDATADRVATLAAADARISLIRHASNRGVSAARNTGLAAASGAYVAFLDADDRWHPTKIARQLAALAATSDAALVFTACRAIDARGAVTDQNLSRGRAIPLGRIDLKDFIIRRYPLITSSVLVERGSLDAAGHFDTSLAVGEDFDLWARILNRYPQAYVPDPLTDYRMHGASATADRLRNRLSKVQVLEKIHASPDFAALAADAEFIAYLHRHYLGAARALRQHGQPAAARELYTRALALDTSWFTRLATRFHRLRPAER
ncbi:MAG: glycosyltransferase [Porticoccaceae bacterium]